MGAEQSVETAPQPTDVLAGATANNAPTPSAVVTTPKQPAAPPPPPPKPTSIDWLNQVGTQQILADQLLLDAASPPSSTPDALLPGALLARPLSRDILVTMMTAPSNNRPPLVDVLANALWADLDAQVLREVSSLMSTSPDASKVAAAFARAIASALLIKGLAGRRSGPEVAALVEVSGDEAMMRSLISEGKTRAGEPAVPSPPPPASPAPPPAAAPAFESVVQVKIAIGDDGESAVRVLQSEEAEASEAAALAEAAAFVVSDAAAPFVLEAAIEEAARRLAVREEVARAAAAKLAAEQAAAEEAAARKAVMQKAAAERSDRAAAASAAMATAAAASGAAFVTPAAPGRTASSAALTASHTALAPTLPATASSPAPPSSSGLRPSKAPSSTAFAAPKPTSGGMSTADLAAAAAAKAAAFKASAPPPATAPPLDLSYSTAAAAGTPVPEAHAAGYASRSWASPRILASRATGGVRRLLFSRDPSSYGHGPTHYVPSLSSSPTSSSSTFRSGYRSSYQDKGPSTSPPKVDAKSTPSPTFFMGRAAEQKGPPLVTPAGPPRLSKNLVRI